MTIFSFFGQLMSILWQFFRIPFPGTNIAVGAIMFLPPVISLAVRLISSIMGSGGSGQNIGNVKNSKSRNSNQQSSKK